MYIVEIIPLQKGIPRDTLSYFSMKDVPLGAIVSVPLQSRSIEGIVIHVNSARDMKSSIRTGNFSLRQINGVVTEQGFPKKIIDRLIILSEQSMMPVGTLITQLFPEQTFQFFLNWKPSLVQKTEIRLIQSSCAGRYEHFKTIIKEQGGKQKSVHIIASTPFEVKKIANFLTDQQSQTVIVFHGLQKPTEREENYTLIQKTLTPVIICSTPQFIAMPRYDIATCIVESYHSPHYVHDFTKTLDYRFVIATFSELFGYTRHLSDNIPSAEFDQIIENRKGYLEREQSATQTLKNKIIITEKEPFNHPLYSSHLFSSGTFDYIQKQIDQKKPVFIFSSRKSVATATTCRDCGYTVECPNCNAVMHLIKKNPLVQTDRVFSCHRCATEIPTMNRCPKCEGWNLIPLGVTQDALEQEIKLKFPNAMTFISNQDVTKTDTACKKIIHAWQQSCGILIGNQKIIPHLDTIPVTIIASFEQLMSIPDYKTPHQTLWLLQNLLEKTDDKFIIQTKNASQEFLHAFKHQNLREIITDDSKLRKQYHYPPFAVLITIIMKNISRKDHHQARDFIKRPLASFDHIVQSHFFEHTQQYEIKTTIHVSKTLWEDYTSPERQSLVNFLKVIKGYTEISIESNFPLPK
jgi:primosomal protein N'